MFWEEEEHQKSYYEKIIIVNILRNVCDIYKSRREMLVCFGNKTRIGINTEVRNCICRAIYQTAGITSEKLVHCALDLWSGEFVNGRHSYGA